MAQRIRDKIKELRGELSQLAYAEKIGTYMLAISQLENGKRPMSIELADKISGGELVMMRELLIMQVDEDLAAYVAEVNRKATAS